MKSTSEFDEIAVFGSRGHSMMILRGLEDRWQGRVRVRAVIDDIDHGFTHPLLQAPMITSDDRLRLYPDLPVLVTPGSTALRERIVARLAQEEAILATASCGGQTHVDPAVDYGAGSVTVPHVRIGPNVRIGRAVQVLATIVAHDVQIDDFTNLNIHCSVLGHVQIGSGVNIAPHAVIGNGTPDRPLRIGDGAIIGVGAVVTRDVPAGARMIGNPAMPVERWKTLNRLLDQG